MSDVNLRYSNRHRKNCLKRQRSVETTTVTSYLYLTLSSWVRVTQTLAKVMRGSTFDRCILPAEAPCIKACRTGNNDESIQGSSESGQNCKLTDPLPMDFRIISREGDGHKLINHGFFRRVVPRPSRESDHVDSHPDQDLLSTASSIFCWKLRIRAICSSTLSLLLQLAC